MFWVECKRRDALTERDKCLNAVWDSLEAALLRYMGPRRLNYAVSIKARVDPEPGDVEYLKGVILNAIRDGGLQDQRQAPADTFAARAIVESSGRFELIVQKLAEPDQEVEGQGMGFNPSEPFDLVKMGCEVRAEEGGRTLLRNPFILATKTAVPPDRVSGVVNALNSASGQLPEGGPGVIWIRVPDGSWGPDLAESFDRARGLLQEQLRGNRNQRVNAVCLFTRSFVRLEKNGVEGRAYQPLTLWIDHENPSSSMPATQS